MRLRDWIRPGIRIKRWLLLGILGVAFISAGITFFIQQTFSDAFRIFLPVSIFVCGSFFIVISTRYLLRTFYYAVSSGGFRVSLDSQRLHGLLFEKRILIKGPKIVAIGGGTGLSTMLRGLKSYSSNLTAVVTVADDGGGSGLLREDLGMLPPGDIRNCVLALANTEPILEQLLQYRFKEGRLKGQSFGNLFLAAMDGISSSFEEAVRKMSDVLAVTGRVLPVTLDDVRLCAELDDETKICGESKIGKFCSSERLKIKNVFLEPPASNPLPEVIDAIMEADAVILGPGSLYTSIIPNLLVDGMCDALKKTKAMKIYVCNVMTQPGETEGFTVRDHISAMEKHSYKGLVDYCIVNNSVIPDDLKEKYKLERAEQVFIDGDDIKSYGIELIEGDFLKVKNNLIRHDPDKLADNIIDLVAETILVEDKKRIIDYYYVKDRLKKTNS